MKVKMKLKCCDVCPGDDSCENVQRCMCGSRMEGHSIGGLGHSPMSVHYFYCRDTGTGADLWPPQDE